MERSLSLKIHARIILCCVLAAATSSCVKLSRRAPVAPASASELSLADRRAPRVSINRASRAELEKLPGIGPALAARIVEHRERHGPFRRAEHLMMVRGISERRYRQLHDLITAE